VALLPFLNEDNLYKQFKLDEPWDSPHNRKLLKRMPAVFAAPGVKGAESGLTYYQVFVGDNAGFEKHRGLPIFEFTDGTSNTLLIAEAGTPVPWTKPEDLHYAADEPLPQLGGLFPDIFNVALADGSVYPLSKKADPELLRKLITRNDGFPVDFAKVKGPSSRREAALRQDNDRLHQEVEMARARLDALRREKDLLQEEDAETARLRQENEQLQQLLQKTRDEAQRLQEEIQRLKKKAGNKPQDE
jgi:hypothetical protein